MQRKIFLIVLTLSLFFTSVDYVLAQEVINSVTGQGYGGSGSSYSNASWLTEGTAIRFFVAPFNKDVIQKQLANPSLRYRYLPFALYLYPEGMPTDSPVHYNLHLSPDGSTIVRSTVPSFNLRSAEMAEAFADLYESSIGTDQKRLSPENLFVKRVLEMSVEGRGFLNIDWSVESSPELIRQFFFTDTNPLVDDWALWFDDWSEANRALVSDYCAAVSFAYISMNLNGEYSLPSKEYCLEEQLEKVSYNDLYQELMFLFNEVDYMDNQAWSIIFEPIADFYPKGDVSSRSYTSVTEIAQVLSEKAYQTDPETYEHLLRLLDNEKDKIPSYGHITRFQASLIFALRNTNIFDDFIFRETRAIFTNNYRNGSYLPDQYLLADALRPEKENENGYLGGWAIVYIRDILQAETETTSMRQINFIDATKAEPEVTGNISFFSSSLPYETVSWYMPDGSSQRINFSPEARMPALSRLLSRTDLSSLGRVYHLSQIIDLNKALLPESFDPRKLVPSVTTIDDSLWQLNAKSVGSDVIGMAQYEIDETNLKAMLEAVAQKSLNLLQESSVENAVHSRRSASTLRSAFTAGTKGEVKPDDSNNLPSVFLNAPAKLSFVPLKDSSEQFVIAANGSRLLEMTGQMPLLTVIRPPQHEVEAKIVAMDLDSHLEMQIEEQFAIADVFSTDIYKDRPKVVFGWQSSSVTPNYEKLKQDLLSLSAEPLVSELEVLRVHHNADIAWLMPEGTNIKGAATELANGSYSGFTVAVFVREAKIDLVLASMTSSAPANGEPGAAYLTAFNPTPTTYATDLLFTTNFDEQDDIHVHINLPPGLSNYEFPYGVPPEGGYIHLEARLNFSYDPEEIDYTNNVQNLDVYVEPIVEAPNSDDACAASQSWSEERYHVWLERKIIYDMVVYVPVYCNHRFDYTLELNEPKLTIGNYSNSIKSGYGIEPSVELTTAGAMVTLETVLGRCNGSSPSPTSQARINLPNVATFRWLPSMGHSLADYEVRNTENNRVQPSFGLALQTLTTSSNLAEYTTAINPASNNSLRRVYLNVALRDGWHRFAISLTGGSIQYNGWSGCLETAVEGGVQILGNMYQDDFSGSTTP